MRRATYRLGCSQGVRQRTLTPSFRRFKSCQPSQKPALGGLCAGGRCFFSRFPDVCPRDKGTSGSYEPLAQPVEHLTFNQGVRGSNPRWFTNKRDKGLFLASLFMPSGIRPLWRPYPFAAARHFPWQGNHRKGPSVERLCRRHSLSEEPRSGSAASGQRRSRCSSSIRLNSAAWDWTNRPFRNSFPRRSNIR